MFSPDDATVSQSARPVPSKLQEKVLQHLFTMHAPIQALMVIATGLGKTYLSIFAVEKYLTPKDTVLFLVNSTFVRD